MGQALPGEHVLILPPNSDAAKAADKAFDTTKTTVAPANEPGNMQQWVNFLFGGNRHVVQ